MGSKKSYNFAIFADPTVGNNYSLPYDYLHNLKETVSGILAHKDDNGLEFAVCVGDMINMFFEDEKLPPLDTRKKMLDLFHSYVNLNEKKVDLHYVAGNHDIGDYPTQETISYYKSIFGDPYYKFEKNGDLFVILESNVLQNSDNDYAKNLKKEQLAWLEQIMKDANKYDNVFLFLHHPMFLNHKKVTYESYDYYVLQNSTRDKIVNIINQHQNVRAVFSGHYHQHDYYEKMGVEYIVLNSCAVPIPQYKDEISPAGYEVVQVRGKEISHVFIDVME